MFIKSLKKLMSCSTCGPASDKNQGQYKCKSCGSTANNEAGECCGAPRENLCACGSGKIAKECCATKA